MDKNLTKDGINCMLHKPVCLGEKVMLINGIRIDPAKLMTRHELLDLLEEDPSDRQLAKVRERYEEDFGNELVWRYPYSDGMHLGTNIVVIKEGFISIPFDTVTKDDYEIFELDDAAMFDDESLDYFIDDYNRISADLITALSDMRYHLKKQAKQ